MKVSKTIRAFSWVSSLFLSFLATSSIAEQINEDVIERGKYLVKIAGCNDCHTVSGKSPCRVMAHG